MATMDKTSIRDEVKGSFPKDTTGKLLYGNGLKVFAVHLILGQIVALNRVQKQISAMINVVISQATLLKFILRLYLSLENWETDAAKTILKASSMHVA